MHAYHDVHVHNFLSSCCSDQTATVENYLQAASDIGLKLIGFANHTWDETIPGASNFYKKQCMAFEMQIKEQIPEDTKGLKVLVGAETEYCGMTDTLGMDKDAALQLDFVLIPHTHVHMRGFVMDTTDDVKRARAKLTEIFGAIEGITPERAASLAGKLPESELEPFMGGRKVDYNQYVADFMVNSFRGLMNNERLKTYSDLVPVSVAHPFSPVGDFGIREEMMKLISDNTFGELFQMAAARGIGLEMNGNSGAPEYVRMYGIAKECGVKFTLGSDTHSCAAFKNVFGSDKCTDALGLTMDDMMEFVRI